MPGEEKSSYQPNPEEVSEAEDMMTNEEKRQTELREEYAKKVEKLKELGREEYRRRSIELAKKIATSVPQASEDLIKEKTKIMREDYEREQRLMDKEGTRYWARYDSSYEAKSASESRDKIQRYSGYFGQEFGHVEEAESDIVRYNSPHPGNTEEPISLLSDRKTAFFPDEIFPHETAESFKAHAHQPTYLPIYWETWRRVEAGLSDEEREFMDLVYVKQFEAQGVFEEG